MEDSTEPDLSLQGHGPPHSASPCPTDLDSPFVCRALPGWALRGVGVYVNYPGAASPHWPSNYHRYSCSAKQTLGGREGGKNRADQALSTHAARTQHGEKQPHQGEELLIPTAQVPCPSTSRWSMAATLESSPDKACILGWGAGEQTLAPCHSPASSGHCPSELAASVDDTGLNSLSPLTFLLSETGT